MNLLNVYHCTNIREGAVEFLYQLLEERPKLANISHAELPSFQQHRQFVTRRPYKHWLLISDNADTTLVGAITATMRNEVGIQIARQYQKQGIGSLALHMFFYNYKPLKEVPGYRRGEWVANISPSNIASISFFERFGSRLIQQSYSLSPYSL